MLSPVEPDEMLYAEEAARLALFNYRAARNFRNIWYHFPEKFDKFREAIVRTWPGMDVDRPEVDSTHEKPRLYMYCPEERIPREIVWSGFGFQVWCQMLTHIIQASDVSLFMIDEPDIYLHSDLQRQLMGILRNLGPDILIATHSTEIISEAETEDIVLINKAKQRATRISDPSKLIEIFSILGSDVNPFLTQLAKTRHVVFVEGKDFQILSRFAKKLGFSEVAGRSGFAVVPIDGFSPDRMRSLKKGMETTLGLKVAAAVVLDRDYRSTAEKTEIEAALKDGTEFSTIHECKEIENFLLVPEAIDRAVKARIRERKERSGEDAEYTEAAEAILREFADQKKHHLAGQFSGSRRRFERERGSKLKDETLLEEELRAFDQRWADQTEQFRIIPGKEAISHLNGILQLKYGVTVTATKIIECMRQDEVPSEMINLIQSLHDFAKASAPSS